MQHLSVLVYNNKTCSTFETDSFFFIHFMVNAVSCIVELTIHKMYDQFNTGRKNGFGPKANDRLVIHHSTMVELRLHFFCGNNSSEYVKYKKSTSPMANPIVKKYQKMNKSF